VGLTLVAWGASVNLEQASGIVRAIATAGLFAGSCVLAVTPGVALVSIAARRIRLGPATGLGLLFAGSGAAAMGGFWAWFESPSLGRAVDVALLAASVTAIGVFGRRGDLRRLDLSQPLALALAVGLVYTGLAFLRGGIAANPVSAIDLRFWHAVDNNIPFLFADRLAARLPLSGYLVGDWLSSDRPPLQTGFTLLQWPLWRGNQEAAYQLLGTGLQLSWLPALWTVLRVRGLGARQVRVAVLATSATGVMFFNTVYVWPKMLAGALALTVLAILVSRDDGDRRPGAGVLAVALATLSVLAHGGTAFALIAFVPFAYRLRRRVTVRSAAACTAAALALYLPWALYQRFVDPPGDRLLKWQLAGVIPIDPRGALETIEQQYRLLSIDQLIANKWDNVVALVGSPALWHTQKSAPAWLGGFLGLARMAQLYDLLPAAGFLLLGALALLSPAGRRVLAPVRPLAAFTGLAIIVWILLLWGGPGVPAFIHQGAYAVVIVGIGLCAVAVTALPRPLAGAVAAVSVAWFAVSWVPGLGFRPALTSAPTAGWTDHAMVLVCAGGLAALAAICAFYELVSRFRVRAVAGEGGLGAGTGVGVPQVHGAGAGGRPVGDVGGDRGGGELVR
jgi:hypothetical protein